MKRRGRLLIRQNKKEAEQHEKLQRLLGISEEEKVGAFTYKSAVSIAIDAIEHDPGELKITVVRPENTIKRSLTIKRDHYLF